MQRARGPPDRPIPRTDHAYIYETTMVCAHGMPICILTLDDMRINPL